MRIDRARARCVSCNRWVVALPAFLLVSLLVPAFPAVAQGVSPSAQGEATVSERLEGGLIELERWRQTATLADLDLPFQRRVGELLLAYDLDELDPWDMGILADLIARDQTRQIPAARRLASMKDDTPAGLTADIVRTWLAMQRLREPVEFTEIEDMLLHPALGDALRRDGAHRIFSLAQGAVATSNDLDFDRLGPGLEALSGAASDSMPVWTSLAAAQLVETLQARDRDHPALAELRTNVRAALLARRTDRPARFAHLDDGIADALKRVSLLDRPAPPLAFEWTSEGFDASTLADLEGRVVLVDFWATWCRPCVAKFPARREVAQHFAGRPVTIVGITAVQGYHYWDPFDNSPPAVTQGDPQREFELMGDYIGLRDITWPIAFVAPEATRDEFFVDALPHAALLAPDGTVYMISEALALKPTADLSELIEAVLAEHGLE